MNKGLILTVSIIVVQIVDLIVHLANGIIEPLRFIFMGGVLLSAILGYLITSESVQIYRGGLIGYGVGNIVFLYLNGFTNDFGNPRILFVIFAVLTFTLLGVLYYRATKEAKFNSETSA